MRSLKKMILLVIFVFTFISYNAEKSNAVKIIAVVGESAITDIDAEDFTEILCLMQNTKQCNKQAVFPMSVMTLVESNIKAEHMLKLGIKDADFKKSYTEYKKNVLKQIKLNNKINKEQFDWYLFTEYKWNAIVSSMLRETKITDEEVKSFQTNNKNLNLSKEQSYNILFNKKLEEKSRSLVNEAKKYYLVDIKI